MTVTKWTTPLLLALGLAAMGQPSLGVPQAAEAKGLSDVRASDARPARELETYGDDVRLTNQCIDRGGDKAECVCVVSVLKYELTLGEYRRAARAWTVPAGYRAQDGVSPMRDADGALRGLTRAEDFQRRCAVAKTYFARTGG